MELRASADKIHFTLSGPLLGDLLLHAEEGASAWRGEGILNVCCDTQLFKDRSNFLVCLMTLAAAVWTSCSCLSDFFLRPVKTQLKPSRLLKINDSTNYFHMWLRQESCRSCSALKGEGGPFHFKWMLNESAHLQLWCVDFCVLDFEWVTFWF